MTRRIDPPLHKPVRLERAQLVRQHALRTLESRRRIWLKRSLPPMRCDWTTPFHLPSMSRSAAPTPQLDEQSRRSRRVRGAAVSFSTLRAMNVRSCVAQG